MSDLDRKIKIARELLKVFADNSVYPMEEEYGNKSITVHAHGEFSCTISYWNDEYALIDLYEEVPADTLLSLAGKEWGQEYFVERTFWPTGGHTYDGRPVSTGVYPRLSMSCKVYPETEVFVLSLTNTYKLEELGKPRVESDSISLDKIVPVTELFQ